MAALPRADVTRGKPDPQVFQVAGQRLGVPPARCAVFEDAAHGIEADNPQHAAQLATMRAALDRWADDTGDTVPANPTPDRADGKVTRGELPGTSRRATTITAPGPIRADDADHATQ